MKNSARYAKVVAWSEEDQTYIGYLPGLLSSGGGCCHGDNEQAVFAELCEIVDEWMEIFAEDGEELPPPTAGYYLGEWLGDAFEKQALHATAGQPA